MYNIHDIFGAPSLIPSRRESNTAVQSQKAVSAYFTSKQILPFGFRLDPICIQDCDPFFR